MTSTEILITIVFAATLFALLRTYFFKKVNKSINTPLSEEDKVDFETTKDYLIPFVEETNNYILEFLTQYPTASINELCLYLNEKTKSNHFDKTLCKQRVQQLIKAGKLIPDKNSYILN